MSTNKYISMLSLLLLLSSGFTQERYDQVRIWTQDTRQTISELSALGLDLEGLDIRRDVYLDFPVSESDKVRLTAAGFQVEELVIDLSAYYASRLAQEPVREFGLGSMGGYYTLTELMANMDSLHAQYPQIVSARDSIGLSWEGRTIWAFKISDNPDQDEAEPEVLYNSLIHAREPAGMMTVMYFAWQLVENYDTDDLLTYLVNERELWFVPVVNPDGYSFNQFTNPNGGGMHRKNMRSGCTSLPGVDLNRNWGYQWGFDDEGSSPDDCAETYRGEEAFSEPETRVLRDFVMSHEFKTVFNYHSYGNLLIRPYGYAPGIPLNGDDESVYEALGNDLVIENRYLFGTGSETVMYATNGDAVDYMYGELGIINFTPEVGLWSQGGFWPAGNQVLTLAQDNLSMNIHLAGVAGDWLRLTHLEIEDAQNLDPGDVVNCDLLVRNKGIGRSAQTVTLTLHSPDSSVVPSIPSFDLSGLAPQDEFILENADLSLEILAASGELATLLVTLDHAGAYSQTDTFSWNVGSPDTVWADDFESGSDFWTSNDWDVSRDAYGGEYAYTESPLGDYPALSTLTTTLTHGIDLRGYTSVALDFMAKWDIEVNYDFCQLLASTNGGNTWTALGGNYTALGNGATVQPLGQPGYQGVQDWVAEHVSLDAYSGVSDLLLRFELVSDTYYEGDGFSVDNLTIMAWGIGFFAGDVTRDGTVDIADVILALEWIIENRNLEAEQLELSDLNQDDLLDVRDLILMIEDILTP